MILPIPNNQSCVSKIEKILWTSGELESEEQQWVDAIKQNFFRNLDYTIVHKNLDYTKDYDAWIFQGNKDDKILGSFKEFLSYPYDTHQFDIGDYISFDYGGDIHDWLLTSLDKKLYYDIKGRIERCNIRLKWQDIDGAIHGYPAVAKEKLTSNKFDFSSDININQGKLTINVRYNENTRLIPINKRFLFGDPYQAFKVISLVNYTDTNTLGIDMVIDNISPTDDLEIGIANYNSYLYSVDILESDFQQIVGYNSQLHYETRINDVVTPLDVVWESSDNNIGTIDQLGNIELLSVGIVVFTCYLSGDPFVKDTINVTCTNTPVNIVDIVIFPIVSDILESETQNFTTKKLINNVDSGEILNIDDITTNIPMGHYIYSSGVNSFSISNVKMYLSEKVKIKVYDNSGNEKTISISLKGLW